MSETSPIPVRAVCAMYGINAATLRNWEKRYGFPSPGRGEGGQRSFSAEDVAAIGRMVALVKGGMTPGEAVKLAAVGDGAGVAGVEVPEDGALAELLEAAYGLDLETMRMIGWKSLEKLGYSRFVEGVAFPLLQKLGREWENSETGVAVEHAVTLVVQGLLMERFLKLPVEKSLPMITMACVPGELHQLPLVHLCNLLTEQRVARPLLLTGGLPISQILKAAEQSGSALVLLSATMAPAAADTREWLDECREAGWLERVMLGGPGFMRSRVFVEYGVRATAGTFDQTVELVRQAVVG